MTSLVCDASPITASELHVEVIRDFDEAAALSGAWSALCGAATGPVFFQSPQWCLFVWRQLSAHDHEVDGRPVVVVVRQGREVVALLPLVIRRAIGCLIAEDMTEPFGQYSDILISPAVDGDKVMALVWAAICKLGVDALMLRKVRDDAAVTPWLRQHARGVGLTRHAPFAEVGSFETHEAYRKTIKSKTRKNLRNYRNRLARDGALHFEVLSDAAERAEVTRQCLSMRTRWLSASGLSSTAFQHPVFRDLVAGLADGTDGAPALMTSRLRYQSHDGKACDVAIQWGFVFGDRYYAYMSAKDPAFDTFSPGRLHLEDIVAHCAAQGLQTVDFLVPDMPYKATWATDRTAVSTYGKSATLRGRAVVDAWTGKSVP
ncbi:MAG: GNAT family N-acetyltransferase, partial [Pseudomonadota bacterium]